MRMWRDKIYTHNATLQNATLMFPTIYRGNVVFVVELKDKWTGYNGTASLNSLITVGKEQLNWLDMAG